MSFVQGILNRRLGIQKISEPVKVEEPTNTENEQEQKVQEPVKVENAPVQETKKKTELPKVMIHKKNARNAGRKANNEEEYEKKRQAAVTRLTKGNMEDLQTVNELKENASKDELTQEIKNTKKKLQLLNDAILFTE